MSFEGQLIEQLLADTGPTFKETASSILGGVFESGREKNFSSALSSMISEVQKDIDNHCSDEHLSYIDEIRSLMEKRANVDRIIKELESIRDDDLGKRADNFLTTLNQMHDIKWMIWDSERRRLSLQIPLAILNSVQKITLLLKDQSLEEGLRELKHLNMLFNTPSPQLPQQLYSSIQDWIPLQYKKLKMKAEDDLKSYFSRQKENSFLIGERAIELWKERITGNGDNSTNVVNDDGLKKNENTQIITDAEVLKDLLDLPGLLNIVHVMDILGERDDFNAKFSKQRQTQCSLLLRFQAITVVGEEEFTTFCKKAIGFLILDYYIQRSAPPFLYGEIWSINNWRSICGAISLLISGSGAGCGGNLGLVFLKEKISEFIGSLEPFVSLFSREEILDSITILNSRWIQENKEIFKEKMYLLKENNTLSSTIMEGINEFVGEYCLFTCNSFLDSTFIQTIDQLISGTIKRFIKEQDDENSSDLASLLKTKKDLSSLKNFLETDLIPKQSQNN